MQGSGNAVPVDVSVTSTRVTLPVKPSAFVAWLLDRLSLEAGWHEDAPGIRLAISTIREFNEPHTYWQIRQYLDGFTVVEPPGQHGPPRAEWRVVPRGVDRCEVRVTLRASAPAEAREALRRMDEDWRASDVAAIPAEPARRNDESAILSEESGMLVQRFVVVKAFKADRDYTPGELINPFDNIGRWRNLAALERGGWLKAIDPHPVSRTPTSSAELPDADRAAVDYDVIVPSVPEHIYHAIRGYLRTHHAAWEIRTTDFRVSTLTVDTVPSSDDLFDSVIRIWAIVDQRGDWACRGAIARFAIRSSGNSSKAVAIVDSPTHLGDMALKLRGPLSVGVSIRPRKHSVIADKGPATFLEVRELFADLGRFLQEGFGVPEPDLSASTSASEETLVSFPPELDKAIRAVFVADGPITERAIGAQMGLSRSHFQRTYLKPRKLTANDLKRRARELDPTKLPGKN